MHTVRNGTGATATPRLDETRVKNRDTTTEAAPTTSQRPLDQEPIHHLREKTGGSRYQALRRVMNQYVAPRPNFEVPKERISARTSRKEDKQTRPKTSKPAPSKPTPLGGPRRREREAAKDRNRPDTEPRQLELDVELNTWKKLRDKLNPLKHLTSKRILNQNGKAVATASVIKEKLQAIDQENLRLEAGVEAPKMEPAPMMTPTQFWIETLLQAESGLAAIVKIAPDLHKYFENIKANGNTLEQLTESQVGSGSTGPLRRMATALETLSLINDGKYKLPFGDAPEQLVSLSKSAQEIRNSVIQPRKTNGPEHLIFKDLGNPETYVFSDGIGKHFVANPSRAQMYEIRTVLYRAMTLHRQVKQALLELQNHGAHSQAGTSSRAGESLVVPRKDKGKGRATT